MPHLFLLFLLFFFNLALLLSPIMLFHQLFWFCLSPLLYVKPWSSLILSNTHPLHSYPHLLIFIFFISLPFASSACKWSCGPEDQPDSTFNYSHGCHSNARTQVACRRWPHPGLRVSSRQQRLHRPSRQWQITGLYIYYSSHIHRKHVAVLMCNNPVPGCQKAKINTCVRG